MLPKSARPTAKSVHYLLRRGKRRHGHWLTILYIRGQHHTRRGVHIAKKVAPLATQRNSAKRAVYAAIDHAGGLEVEDGLFFVTVNKKYTDKRKQLIVSPSETSIYTRVLALASSDMIKFVQSLKY